MTARFLTRRQFLRASALLGAAGIAYLGAEAVFVEPRRPVVERVEVLLDRLPKELDGLTIVQLTDLHYESAASAEIIRTAVQITNRLAPDMVVLTGDYVSVYPFQNPSRVAEDSKPCAQILADLHSPLGTFAVLGNHDCGSNPVIIRRSLEAHGIATLRNFNLRVEKGGATFWIAGVDDVLAGQPRLDKALQGIPGEAVTILLAHEPDFADQVAAYPVHLQLSGHSHGGQVRLPFIGPPYLPRLARKYPQGLRKLGRLNLYTSRGVGTVFLPIRLNCPPEITFLTLRAFS